MKLSRKQVSIFPTQHGFLFLAILIAMLLGAINYNNAGFILVFLLGGMALISIFYSFKNLVGIEIHYLSPLPVFAGQTATFPVHVKAPAAGGRSITFSLMPQDPLFVSVYREKNLQMEILARKRGILHPRSLTLKSVYPFGLFTFCTLLPVEATCLAYPRPIPGTHETAKSGLLPDGEEQTSRQGADDFQGLKKSHQHHCYPHHLRPCGGHCPPHLRASPVDQCLVSCHVGVYAGAIENRMALARRPYPIWTGRYRNYRAAADLSCPDKGRCLCRASGTHGSHQAL